MKGFLKFVVFVAVVGAAGYFGWPHIEPHARPLVEKILEGGSPDEVAPVDVTSPEALEKAAVVSEKKRNLSDLEKSVIELYPDPNIPPLLEMVKNWTDVPDRVFPRKLVTSRAVDFELSRDGKVIGARGIPAGSEVIGKAFEDGKLTITPVGSELMTAKVDVDAVNLKESIEKGYNAFVQAAVDRVTTRRSSELARMTKMKDEERIRLTGWTDGANEVFKPMRESLQGGAIEGYKLTDAKKWRWIGAETINGRDYDVGLVELYSETIFGIFPSEAKALISNGKVERWVDPDSGEPFEP